MTIFVTVALVLTCFSIPLYFHICILYSFVVNTLNTFFFFKYGKKKKNVGR